MKWIPDYLRHMKEHWLRATALAVLAFLGFCFVMGYFKTVQISTATGELRYVFMGIPYRGEKQFSSAQSSLESALALLPDFKEQWVRCGRANPWMAEEDIEEECWSLQRVYRLVALWSEIDPAIAGLLIEDIADHIVETKAGPWTGLRGAGALIGLNVLDHEGSVYSVGSDWWKDESTLEYLSNRGYRISRAQTQGVLDESGRTGADAGETP